MILFIYNIIKQEICSPVSERDLSALPGDTAGSPLLHMSPRLPRAGSSGNLYL